MNPNNYGKGSSAPNVPFPQAHLIMDPEKALTFTWSYPQDPMLREQAIRQSPPKTVLKARNPDLKTVVAFKVKTTAPKRYVVRPPQGFVRPGEEATIVMSMVIKDSMELADKLHSGETVDEAKTNKFLVQFTDVEEDFYTQKLEDASDKDIASALSSMWGEVDKKKITSVKLTTKFNMAPGTEKKPGDRNCQLPADSPSVDDMNDDFLFMKGKNTKEPSYAKGSQEGAIFAELSALRKKYDDLVAYTVVLTGERDYLNNECQIMKDKLELEVASKRTEENSGGGTETQVVSKPETTSSMTLLIQAFAIALIAFVAGSFLT